MDTATVAVSAHGAASNAAILASGTKYITYYYKGSHLTALAGSANSVNLTIKVDALQGFGANGVIVNDISVNAVSFGVNTPIALRNGAAYRYGFNGMERDDEMKGSGNSYDFGARMYDSRLGRWMSLDPLQAKYSSFSPYCFVANTPLIAIDPDGRDIYFVNRNLSPSSPKIRKQNFANIINYLNSAKAGKELLSEYLQDNTKNLYISIGKVDIPGDAGNTIDYIDSEGKASKPNLTEIGGNSYLSNSKNVFDGTLIDNPDAENSFVVLNEDLFGPDKYDKPTDGYENLYGAKVLGHEVGAHVNNPSLDGELEHSEFGQDHYSSKFDTGEGFAKVLNEGLNAVKKVTNDLSLEKTRQTDVYKVSENTK